MHVYIFTSVVSTLENHEAASILTIPVLGSNLEIFLRRR